MPEPLHDSSRTRRHLRAVAAVCGIMLCSMLAGSPTAEAAVAWYPTKLYSGMNVITITASSGIARVRYRTRNGWVDARTGVGLRNLRLVSVPKLAGCPRKVRLFIYVPLVTERATIELQAIECSGDLSSRRLSSDEMWEVDYVDMGTVEPGTTTCARLRVENRYNQHTIDRVVSQSSRFRIQFTGIRPPVRIDPGVVYHYNVCFVGTRPGSYRLPIHVYIRRDQPAGGFDSFIVADTVVVRVVQPSRPGAPARAPRAPVKPRAPRAAPRPAIVQEPPAARPLPDVTRVALRPAPAPGPVPGALERPPRLDTLATASMAPLSMIDPTTFRVLIMPTARSVPAGQSFIASYDVAGIIAGHGVTDRLTVNGGGLFIPDALGDQIVDATLGSRYEFLTSDYWRLAAGVQYNYSHSDSSTIHLVVPFVAASYGDDDYRANVIVGFTERRHAPASEPAFNRSAGIVAIGADALVAPRWKVVGEAYFIAASEYQPMAVSVRHFSEDWALDIGGALNLGSSGPKLAPVVSFVWVLGRGRTP